ncbi:MAG TPA: S8 family serine peptidase [Thermoanaerobaculia bacterium]|nr:S8 family serine peptidase [Thermoanaerobaculia bacterium]
MSALSDSERFSNRLPSAFSLPAVFAVALIAISPALANETSWHSLQSGSPFGPTPIHDHGIHGEGQVIAILDTGLDYDNCYFAEPDGSRPPVNTGTPQGGLADANVDPSRRKVIAYDFDYSCDQYPGATGCDDPSNPKAWDNQGHGTHAAAAAAGDKGTPIVHDAYDAIAPGAKLVIQDAGYIGGDNCSQRPGIGCPVNLTPLLTQAYRQGARIHSNSWGDRQGVSAFLPPPTANYSASAREVDAFVWTHPDMLIVFNTGNTSTTDIPPASTLSAPGCAKNVLQTGGTRTQTASDDTISVFTLLGPSRDGRIKPDLVGPAMVTAGDSDLDVRTGHCDISPQPGTSWSAPTIAGAAALVRQYFTDGYYPSGMETPSDGFVPSAALLKATLIAAARPVPYRGVAAGATSALPVPSNEQGWGFPVLGDVLWFPGENRRIHVADVADASGLAGGESASIRVSVSAGTPFKAVLVWTDPPGVVRTTADTTPELVNDLDLRVTTSSGAGLWGNESLHPGQPDRLNNVEVVSIAAPASGIFTISVTASHLGLGPRQGYALVLTGDIAPAPRTRAVRH